MGHIYNMKNQEIKKTIKDSDITRWEIDSGCTTHCTHEKEYLSNFDPNTNQKLIVANNEYLFSKGSGDISNKLKHVLYVPEFTSNLLSISTIISITAL